eukprot:COSAG06_NODE_3225_length_5655_cov_4263.650108_1_plen_304_part_10
MPIESRSEFEKGFLATAKAIFEAVAKSTTERRVRDVIASSMKAGVLSSDDIALACGWCSVVHYYGYIHPGALTTANESGVFSAALALYQRIDPSPRPGEWWSSTCDVVDVTSALLAPVWFLFGAVKRLPSAVQSSWFHELRIHAIRMINLNASAGLSGRTTMAVMPVVMALGVVEVASQEESQHETLIESGVMDPLLYGILEDFTYGGLSVATYASGAAVALVGRNEGGKVLRREAVHAVLERLHQHFQPEHWGFSSPAKTVMASLSRVTIVVVSDANKKHMLQFEPLIDMLLQCLITDDDNHR